MNMFSMLTRALLLLSVGVLMGCAGATSPLVVSHSTISPPAASLQCPETSPAAMAMAAPSVKQNLRAAAWEDLPGWRDSDQLATWPAWLTTCTVLQRKAAWKPACQAAVNLWPTRDAAVRDYFEQWFNVYQSALPDGSMSGLVTGYYTPLLRGSYTRTATFNVPLYSTPSDLLSIDLSSVYPQLAGMRLRGRMQGNKVVPYWSRTQIDGKSHPLAGNELVWLDNAVDAFFLQIQGSGRIMLPDGRQITVGYADQNGYPYQAIGRILVARGEMNINQVSMQSIRAWGQAHSVQLPELLAQNSSYVFFRLLPDTLPLSALGVPVSAGRSIAVDPQAIPLGAPVWLVTTQPNSTLSLDRLVLAQDTGGAIHGNVRADVYVGLGDEAGSIAGKMKQLGQMWVLLPKH